MYVFISMYVCVCGCLFVCVIVCVCLFVYVCVCVSEFAYVYLCTHICIYIRTYILYVYPRLLTLRKHQVDPHLMLPSRSVSLRQF